MSPRVKICGLREARHVTAAVRGGAAYVGFVFFPKSVRNVSIDLARDLAVDVPPGVAKVALTVNADDATLDEINARVPLDMLQLHGSESPDRVAEVRARYRLPVMKAVGLRDESDLPTLDAALQVADQVLVDAKATGPVPGGNGIAFDWKLLSGRRWSRPWMLAGGLTPFNLSQAINLTGATQVDVSSGVESAPGVKDEAMIDAFLTAARS